MTIGFYGSDDTTKSWNLKFECSMDGSAFSMCDRPVALTDLADGKHVFEVRAVDKQGSKDQTPAAFTWIVDTAIPILKLSYKADGNGQPITNNGSTDSTTATFTWYAIDDNTKSWKHTFMCRLDSNFVQPWQECTRPQVFNGLSVGKHTFEVAAVDLADNWSNPILFTWNVVNP
jgi:hypothetical protein